MNRKGMLEKTAILFGIAVVVCAIWFWNMQLDDTLTTLKMAYPD
jgi:hypothetical protein